MNECLKLFRVYLADSALLYGLCANGMRVHDAQNGRSCLLRIRTVGRWWNRSQHEEWLLWVSCHSRDKHFVFQMMVSWISTAYENIMKSFLWNPMFHVFIFSILTACVGFFSRYLKDLVILSSFVEVLAVFSNYFWWLMFLVRWTIQWYSRALTQLQFKLLC